MTRMVRAVALLAVLAVLLGGVVVVLLRGDPVPTELLAPLGVITAALVWQEKRADDEEGQEDASGEKRRKRLDESAREDGQT